MNATEIKSILFGASKPLLLLIYKLKINSSKLLLTAQFQKTVNFKISSQLPTTEISL